MDLNEPPAELVDPISLDLFEDPILLPCGNMISRNEIAKHLANDPKKLCPLCRQPMVNFDPGTATPVRQIANAVEEYRRKKNVKAPENAPAVDNSKWTATLVPVVDSSGKILPISEFRLDLEGAIVVPKPGLFIAIMDKSGSMSGNPWSQVQSGLRHIVSLAANNPFVKVEVIAYQSVAEILDLGLNLASALNAINMHQAGGGTNFLDAFAKVGNVLSKYYCSDLGSISEGRTNLTDVSSVNIAFLTDGCADGLTDDVSRRQLANHLRVILAEKWLGPVTVHSVGFGRDHDKVFLEEMWKTGHTANGAPLEGTFRYAEPQDNSDTLSRKLSSLFESISKASTIPLKLTQNLGRYLSLRNIEGSTCHLQFPIGHGGKGSYTFWIQRDSNSIELCDGMFCQLQIGEKEISVPLVDGYKLPNFKLIRSHLYAKWLSKLTDDLAAELLEMTKVDKVQYGLKVFSLHCLLIDRQATLLKRQCQTGDSKDSLIEATVQRLDILSRDALALQAGLQVNVGHLADLRFGAQYLLAKPAAPVLPTLPSVVTPSLTQIAPANYDERTVYYPRRGPEALEKTRNPLQTKIVQLECDMYKRDQETPKQIREIIEKADCGALVCPDLDGNNTLMLAAYCGHRTLTEALLKRGREVHLLEADFLHWLQQKNFDGETALTLAIKARGYDDTVSLLIKFGAVIPPERQDALYRYCIDHRFRRTSKLLVNPNSVVTHANPNMTEDYLEIAFQSAAAKSESLARINFPSYLNAAIVKGLPRLVELILSVAATLPFEKLGLSPTLMEPLCILDDTKPEAVAIANLFFAFLEKSLNKQQLKEFINEPLSDSCDSLLFRAADRGSPYLLKQCLKHGASVDQVNPLGNSPLWIACERRWPCIIDTLLEHGANPNHTNLKGNSPLTTICQKGTKVNAEKLLACGANPNNINRNGDSLILICCRNGQPEVLKLLLDRVDAKILEHIAEIDGFGPMLAATEANRPECIRILFEYGLSLEVKTAADNQILAGAAPLHLAAYYGRLEATQTLLELGANPDSLDVHGQTALHTAVIRGQIAMVKLLRSRCKIDARDKSGQTAAGYCRNEELRAALIDPLLRPLMELSRGQFAKEQDKAANLLFSKKTMGELMLIRNSEGRTPLIEAVLAGNLAMVEVYLQCGASVQDRDYSGINSYVWACLTGNARIKARLSQGLNVNVLEEDSALENVRRAAHKNSIDARTMFIGSSPANIQLEVTQSSLGQRMITFVSQLRPIQIGGGKEAYQTTQAIFNLDEKSADIELPDGSRKIMFDGEPISIINFLTWETKVFIVSKIAAGTTFLSPQQIGALYMYDTLSLNLLNGLKLDDSHQLDYLRMIHSAVDRMIPYSGEIYWGVPSLPDRSLFAVGNEFSCSISPPATSSWCVAAENVPEFSTKKQGVVFIIQQKRARSISSFTRFPYDMEVVFPINTRFRVVKWYRGDVICLGQANIREHTFKIKDEDLPRYLTTNAALIIEMVEL